MSTRSLKAILFSSFIHYIIDLNTPFHRLKLNLKDEIYTVILRLSTIIARKF